MREGHSVTLGWEGAWVQKSYPLSLEEVGIGPKVGGNFLQREQTADHTLVHHPSVKRDIHRDNKDRAELTTTITYNTSKRHTAELEIPIIIRRKAPPIISNDAILV